jgi:hypothetical protein
MGYRVVRLLLMVWMACLLSPSLLPGVEIGKAVIRADGSPLKERPGSDSETIVALEKGEAVLIILCLKDTDTVLGITGHWCLVRYRGVEGWVFDTVLDTKDPRAETSYRDVASLAEETDRLGQLRESHKLEATERLSSLIIDQIEYNFSRNQIIESRRLSGTLVSAFSDRIEALLYLHRFDEAKETYDYVIKAYPDIKMEGDFASARELLEPFIVFMEHYSAAPVFKNPIEPMKKLKASLEKRDLALVSALALPGIFEMWVAYTDWVIKLGDQELDKQQWLAGSWETPWMIREVSTRTDSSGNLIGYCIVTEPWDLNYYEIQVNRVDFCIDKLPDETYAFSYLILYTEPIR